MEAVPRNTPALLARIDQLRNSLIKRFENLIELAAIDKTDRNATALSQYQIQIETGALRPALQIRSAEDILSLTRQLQELWLFGQLKTLEDSETLQKTDEDARAIAALLRQLEESGKEAALDPIK
ncbi:hypothetical protein M8818_005694 [Zalaria obscura]|uniref:Uncharacterized protein n=1 Tax=Zalaria obscura TaxID=2024903 RepID=A0ACC3S9M0_9PEZI